MSNTQQSTPTNTTRRASNRRLVIHGAVKEELRRQGRTMTWLYQQMGVSRQYLTFTLNGTYPWPEERIAQLNTLLGTSFSLPE